MTGNYDGGKTGDLERELCARWRLGVSSISSHRHPQKLQIYDVSLSVLCSYLVCLFVCFCAFVCPDDDIFDGKLCLLCELICGWALGFDDDVD